jgi:large subunit ribosomal protein L3
MTIGLIGQKCGMTRIFTDDGANVPVTVVLVKPNRISQVKNPENDGYNAIQVAYGENKLASRVNKPEAGHFAKAGIDARTGICEFRIDDAEGKDLSLGGEFKVDLFKEGDVVDVSGVTKGKGFAGVIKRYHFATQDATHGNSLSHRAPGSIGQRQTPGRVFKGKKMAGHLGNTNRTMQNLVVVKVDTQRNLLLIKGSVPGAPGGYVLVKPAVKLGKRG